MRKRKLDRIARLVNRYPALGLLRADWRWIDAKSKQHEPTIKAAEVVTLPDYLLARPDESATRRPHALVQHPTKSWRGHRRLFVLAIGHNERVLGTMYWEHPQSKKETCGDIFKYIQSREVKALFWVESVKWHDVESSGKQIGVELAVTIMPCPTEGWDSLANEVVQGLELVKRARQLLNAATIRERRKVAESIAEDFGKS